MTKELTPEKWLSHDIDQLIWADRYLHKRGKSNRILEGVLSDNYKPPGRDFTLRDINDLFNYTTGPEMFRKMKVAWNQHCYKKKRGRKTYSFVMSTTIEKRLEFLKQGANLNATIENIINNSFEEVSKKQSELKDKFDRKEANLEKKYKTVIEKLKKGKVPLLMGPEARRREQTQKELQKKFNELQKEICLCLVRMEDKGVLESAPTIEQQYRANQKYAELSKMPKNQDLEFLISEHLDQIKGSDEEDGPNNPPTTV